MTGPRADESFISWKGEIYRKGIHLTSLSIPVGFFLFDSRVIVVCLILALGLSAIFDLIRFFGSEALKRYLASLFGFLLRPREKKSFSGSTTIILAGLLVYYFYDLRIAAASMVIVVVGDTAAALTGRLVGRFKFYNKSLEGTLGFILFTSLAILVVPEIDTRVAISGVLVGALVELLPIPIDDNITVPLAAGGFMQILIRRLIIY